MSNFRLIAAAVLLALAAACASPAKPHFSMGQAIDEKERNSVDALNFRAKYKDAVMGDDVKGTTLILYVDRSNVESMDEPVEDAMIDDVLAHWKPIWSANHRGKHAKLHVSVRDYYGSELSSRSATV